MSAPGTAGPPDAELVARVLTGDREAFAAVYDRYGGRLFDFAYSMLRHREDAADVVADSFVLFAERLGQLRDPDRLRPWLYAIVRSECLRRFKARKRVATGGDDQLIAMADTSRGPEDEAQVSALRELVWDAAAGLAPRDRALLDLHLRQGLEGAELGEAMGVSAANAYVMLTRLRDQVERSLGALLVARLGRDDCPELTDLLADWDGTFSPLIRKRVARHVDRCDVCGERRRTVASPWALLASVPLFTAPLALRDRVLGETQLVAYTTSPGATASRWATRPTIAAIGAGVVALLIGAVIVLWPDGAAEPVPPAPTPDVTPTATPSPTPDPVPGSIELSTTLIDLGADGSRGSVRLTNPGDLPVEVSVTTPDSWLSVEPTPLTVAGGGTADVVVSATRSALREGPSTGTLSLAWDGGSGVVTVRLTERRPPRVGAPSAGASTCAGGGRMVVVTVAASDESGLRGVVLAWSGPSGSGEAAMSESANGWSAVMGPIPIGGEVTMSVTATDPHGATATGPATTMHVDPCPM